MMIDPGAMVRLSKALNLPSMTISMTLSFAAGELATITIQRLLTKEEVEALAEWYEVEDLTMVPTETTYYNLVSKQSEDS